MEGEEKGSPIAVRILAKGSQFVRLRRI